MVIIKQLLNNWLSSRRLKPLLLLLLTTFLIPCISETAKVDFMTNIEIGGKELISNGFPTMGNSELIYINVTDVITWKLNAKYFEKFNESDVFKIMFKFWANETHPKTFRISSFITFDENMNVVESLIDRYTTGGYNNNWMDYEFIFINKDRNFISISTKLGTNKDFVAFKDIKIEQELNEINVKSVKMKDNLTLNSWDIFNLETEQITLQSENDFLYFGNECNNGCEIFAQIDAKEIRLKFEYISRNAEILFDSELFSDIIKDQQNWTLFDETVKDLKSLKIIILTKDIISFSQKPSFLAIKGMNVELTNEKNIKSKIFCNDTDCALKFTPKPLLARDLPKLHITDSFLYTKRSLSTIELLVREDILSIDQCLNFEYMSKSPETELIFAYIIKDDNFKQIFFISKLFISDKFLSHETLCLSNFIALKNTKNSLKLSITVKFNNETNNMAQNELYLRSLKINNGTLNRLKSIDNRLMGYLSDFSSESWKNQWIITNGSLFSMKDSNIDFKAKNPEASQKSSEISSDWVIYDSKNGEHLSKNGNIMVWFEDRNSFNYFTLSAKVCNSLSKCKLCSLKRNEISNETHFYYDFNFVGFNITETGKELIRLVLIVKYGLINDNREMKMNLRVLNFGNPCFNRKYCKIDDSDQMHPKPLIDCPQGLTGDYCDKKDFCFIRDNYTDESKHIKLMSGDHICSVITEDKAECISKNNTFRCECERIDDYKFGPIFTQRKLFLNNIFIENQYPKCEQSTLQFTDWNNDQIPNTDANNLRINFTDINAKNTDICVKLSYDSIGVTFIRIIYNTEELFEVSLTIGRNQIFEFCVLDFKTNIDQNFVLNLKFRNDLPKFKLINILSKGKLAKFSSDHKTYKDLGNFSQWIILPRGIQTTVNGKVLSFKEKSSFKALLTSHWIQSNSDFNEFENSFKLELNLDKTLIQWFKLNQIIQTNTSRLYEKTILFNQNSMPIKLNEKINFDKVIETPFRIAFEIIFTVPEKQPADLSLTIQDLVFGNPCKSATGVDTCPAGQTCIPQTFGKKLCNCTTNCNPTCDSFRPDNKVSASEYCRQLVSIPTIENGCKDIDKSFRCFCPNSDFVWVRPTRDYLFGRCERISIPTLSEHCLSSKCDFLEIGKQNWLKSSINGLNSEFNFQ